MFSKEEIKEIRIQFWNQFNAEMRNVRSSNGRKMNWLQYPSDAKDIYIRLDCDQLGARLCVDFQFKDAGIMQIVWEQMHELKNVLEIHMGKNGIWQENISTPQVASLNRICWENNDLSLFRPSDHAKIRSFLKDRIVSFDSFYQEYKDILINLLD